MCMVCYSGNEPPPLSNSPIIDKNKTIITRLPWRFRACVCVCFTSRDICMTFEMSVEIMKPGSMLLSQYRLPESGTYLHSRSLFLCFSFFLFVSWGAACLSYLNIIQATPSCSDNNFLTKDEITASSKLKLQARKQAIWWMLHASFFTIFLCCCNCMSMAE